MHRRFTAHLLIPLDPSGGTTMQRQIYGGIRRAILERRVAPGTRLPSTRALAHDLGVSRTTSLLALEQLRAEGYVAMRGGSGTYVANDLPDESQRAVAARPAPAGLHPPLSARGTLLADTPTAARRLSGPPRPFRVGTPALDLFPTRLWASLVHRRLRAQGLADLDYGACHALRQAIAGHLQTSRDTRCTPDQILVVAGAQVGLDVLARVLLDPGDMAWLEEPGYSFARAALVAAGARVVPVPVDAEGLDVEAGLKRARGARLAYVTPSHQFPLGVAMSLRRRLALLEWASQARAWILEDDYDSEFRYHHRPVPCLHGLDVDGRVIYVGSFSKTLFPALRLGFVVVPPDVRERIVLARRSLDIQPPGLEQAVLADFIGEGHFERHLRRMRGAYRERMEAMREGAERYCGGALRMRPVMTGLHAVGDLVGVADDVVADAAAVRGLEVTPLSSYYRGTTEAPNGLVLGFGAVPPDGVTRGMRELAMVLDRLQRAPDQARAVTR
jgi:GntR family transcriptional regulator/MocR family aminotransferase